MKRTLLTVALASFAVLTLVAIAAEPLPSEPAGESMTVGQAIVLGIVEGLTEYLPVSSTGRLVLAQRAMGIGQSDVADAYAFCIQFGAILAVLGIFFRHLLKIGKGFIGRDAEGRRLGWSLFLAFLPAPLLGFFVIESVTAKLFGLWPIVWAWLLGGLAILAFRYIRKHPGEDTRFGLYELTWKKALVIGLIQCIAIWPGTSRSLVTIVGGVLVGMELSAAVIFSFLLGALTLLAVTIYQGIHHGASMLDAYGGASLLAGFLAAMISAVIAVEWLVTYIKRHGLAIFGWYRVALAVAVAGLLLLGVMEPR